jgi:choline kinase
MNVVILAAGTGSRLGDKTRLVPKPALLVAGRPLLGMTIAFARLAGATKIVVIAGYRREITERLAWQHGADAVLWNPRFADAGNALSLRVARDAGHCDAELLIMNSDHVYRPTIAQVIAAARARAAGVTAFIDRDRALGPDDMKVRLDAQERVIAIAKTLDAWDAGYVGMTLVPAPAAAAHARACAQLGDDRAHVEAALARLAPVATADVSGHGWLEVDDEQDLARAEEALARDPWYEDTR